MSESVWKFIFLIPFFESCEGIPDVGVDVTNVASDVVWSSSVINVLFDVVWSSPVDLSESGS
jgi:hypothetical protein